MAVWSRNRSLDHFCIEDRKAPFGVLFAFETVVACNNKKQLLTGKNAVC